MKNTRQKIALFGGTFAPPHLGHVHAVRTLAEHIDVDRIIIMPTFMPPHKVKVKGDTPELRLEMCRAAFGEIDKACVSDYEIVKGGVSYTVHTLEYLTEEYDADIYLLCGTDMFLTLDTWFRAERIFSLAKIVCIPRYTDSTDLLCVKKQEYEDAFGADVRIIGSDPFEVSSTEIRRMIADNEDLSEYLPAGVIDIIRREKLYNESDKHE
jgi:nicotinate-nucleotide adenylyltransferase